MAITIRHLILFFCLLASNALDAQTAKVPALPQVQLHFSVFAQNMIQDLVYKSTAETPPTAINFYPSYRSPSYTYKGDVLLRFYDAKTFGPGAKPVAVCNVPVTTKKAFLLFFPRAEPSTDGIKYDVYGMDDSTESIPAGRFVILNASNRQYAARIGNQVVRLSPGISPVLNPTSADVDFQLYAEGSEEPVISEKFRINEKSRMVMVFFPPRSETGIRPVIRRLSDKLPADTENRFAMLGR